jgi:hypothetical protein
MKYSLDSRLPHHRSVAVLLVCLLLAGCVTPPIARAPEPGAPGEPRLEDARLTELSGLAPSLRRPGWYWGHNDSGHPPRLFVFDETGAARGSVWLEDATHADWEDMASFTLDGVAWLAIGDVGDNRAVRHNTAIYLLPEPDPADLAPGHELRLRPSVRIPVVYPEGPRDGESLAVDPREGVIFLISKRTVPAVVYTLPLTVDPTVAVRTPPAAPLVPLELPQPSAAQRLIPAPAGPFGSQPTAMDLAPDGSGAVVLTYAEVWYYERAPGETWAEVFARRPLSLGPTELWQAEAVCFTLDGREILFSTEGEYAPLIRWPVPER